ncbi:MAG: gamma-glutamylcyclotransferase family protein [Cyanobacteria bacterium P01_A01_bin.40]
MTQPKSFIYFAYGSNMSTRRLRHRTPSAKPLGIGQLSQHQFVLHKIGRDGSAKCDIQETGQAHDIVWGVLFEIFTEERHLLDRAEGLGFGYEYKTVRVNSNEGIIIAGAYYATHIDSSLRPFDWYLNFVLRGAEEHGLPNSYLNYLKSCLIVIDPDSERRKRNFSLLEDNQYKL